MTPSRMRRNGRNRFTDGELPSTVYEVFTPSFLSRRSRSRFNQECRLGRVADSKASLTSLIELMKVELLLFQKNTLGAFEPRNGDSHGER